MYMCKPFKTIHSNINFLMYTANCFGMMVVQNVYMYLHVIAGDNGQVLYLEEVPLHAIGNFKGTCTCVHCTVHVCKKQIQSPFHA